MSKIIHPKYLIYVTILACIFCCQTYGEPNDSNSSQREPNKTVLPDTNNLVPFIGDETPLSLIEAYPERYIEKSFYLIGAASITNYYNWKYSNADKTHVSFDLEEIRANKTLTGKTITLYLEKQYSQPLVDLIIKTIESGFRAKIIRVEAIILSKRFEPKSEIMAELLNWQTLTDDRLHWTEWQISPKPARGKTPEETIKSDKIVYRGIERNERWFNLMYKRFGNKIIDVNGKFVDVSEQIMKPKIIDSNIQDMPVGTIVRFQNPCKVISLLSKNGVIASTNSNSDNLVYLLGLENVKKEILIPRGFKFVYRGQFKSDNQTMPSFSLLKPLTKEEFKKALKADIDFLGGS